MRKIFANLSAFQKVRTLIGKAVIVHRNQKASRVSDRSLITQLKKNNNKIQGTVKWVGFLCLILQFAKTSGFIVLKVNSEVRQDPKFNLGLPNAYKLPD